MKNWNSRPEWTDNPKNDALPKIRNGNHGNGRPDRASKLARKVARRETRAEK